MTWKYHQIVLSADHHLSYPFVFLHEGSYWMVPEESEIGVIRVYSSSDPMGPWTARYVVAEGLPYEDSSLIRYEGRWWLFASTSDVGRPESSRSSPMRSTDHGNGIPRCTNTIISVGPAADRSSMINV